MNPEDAIENNKMIVRKFLEELINRKRLELYDQLFHDDYQYPFLNNLLSKQRVDHEKNKLLFGKMFETSDWFFEIIKIIAEDNWVVVLSNYSRTIRSSSGEIDYIIDRPSKVLEASIFQMKDGKICKCHRIFNKFDYYLNLGILDQMIDSNTKESLVSYVEQMKSQRLIE
ncbi:MAG: nuclear transport factor 2 family protein [Candidatus Kariarchaeaceae archaeon]|jgi:hypothetical protein